ncbi:MAG: ABC transporter substrate-binding protein [Alphaproteobacteria bacterium]
MKRIARAASLAAAVSLIAMVASAEEVRVGLLVTLSGPAAAVGKDHKNGWDLAVDHLGGKVGGVPLKTIYGDDQLKPDVALGVVDKMLNQDKVHFVSGGMWTNIVMAIKDPILKSGAIFVGTLAGPPQLAGKGCDPNFILTSFSGDQWAEATGVLMNSDGIKNVYALVPNYQGGKDQLAGFERFFKGEILQRNLFKLNTVDYQPELTDIRARKPQAVVIFAPGGMAIAFFKQWAQSGLGKDIKLYSIASMDQIALRATGESAVGSRFAQAWDPNGTSPANQRFVKDFIAKYKSAPTHFAAWAYDGPMLIDSGVKAVKGNVADKKGMIVAMRKADYASVRGAYSYNVNQFPIQNFYKMAVVLGADGKPTLKTEGIALPNHKDSYYQDCKMPF